MKKTLFIVAILFIGLSSCKKDKFKKMIVEKDCTGTYLRGKNDYFVLGDFIVCNESILSSYNNGDIVKVIFDKIESCDDPNRQNHCMILHEHKTQGWVNVKKAE